MTVTVLAYTQAQADWSNMFVKVLKGFQIPGATPHEYLLKIEKT